MNGSGESGSGLKVEFESFAGDTDDGGIRARVERLGDGCEWRPRHFGSLWVNGLKWC